ncbi:Highly reducing polyketide synthase gloL [Cladobotryum mycophilum]|uniref:Highly reducing polyketide synthase gloL n=1 Tax=Cladobotryum mycophilum TaxID=491253 RepID=A0ABR0SPV4_9HYPO
MPYKANYASANTFLDSFMQYRHSLVLPCSVPHLGVMEGIGFVSNHSALTKQYRSIGAYMVQEQELMDALEVCIQKSQSHVPEEQTRRRYINLSHIVIGLVSTRPLSNPNNPTPLIADARIGMYQRVDSTTQMSASSNDRSLRALLGSVAVQLELLLETNTIDLLTLEMGRTLFSLIHLPIDSLDVTSSLTSSGINFLISIELRNWWRRTLMKDVSILEIINTGTIKGLGKLAIASLKEKYGMDEGDMKSAEKGYAVMANETEGK